jgi:hypothetical protein
MHLSYGSIFRIDFSYTDRVRYNSARISSFFKFSIFRKFVFVFVSDFTAFAFVFVFQCKSRKRLRGFSTVFMASVGGHAGDLPRTVLLENNLVP